MILGPESRRAAAVGEEANVNLCCTIPAAWADLRGCEHLKRNLAMSASVKLITACEV